MPLLLQIILKVQKRLPHLDEEILQSMRQPFPVIAVRADAAARICRRVCVSGAASAAVRAAVRTAEAAAQAVCRGGGLAPVYT